MLAMSHTKRMIRRALHYCRVSQLCEQAVVVEFVWLVVETMDMKKAVGVAVEHVQQGHQRACLQANRMFMSKDAARHEAGNNVCQTD